MKTVAIRTEREKAWTLFKLADKHNRGYTEIDNSQPDTVAATFIVKPILFSEKLGEKILMMKAKKALS